MRIVHVTDFYLPRVGGIERQVNGIATAQAAAGHEVHVVTSTVPDGSAVDPGSVLVHRLPTDGREHVGLLAGPSALRQVGAVVAALDPDVVHAHSSVASPLALAGAAASSRAGTPTVVTVHSMWAALAGPYRTLLARTGLASLPICWSAVSEVAAHDVQRALGPDGRVLIVPNGIDGLRWAPRPDVAARRSDEVHVVSVLRFAPRKRPLALMRALRTARLTLDPQIALRATILGDGPLRRPAAAYAKARDMPWVALPGTQPPEAVAETLRDATFFVSTARLESFGIAALEARCAGLPVVALSGTGIEDFIEDGREGLIAADDGALTRAVARLAGSAELRAAMTAHNRAVPPRACWDATLAAAADAYDEAAKMALNAPTAGRAGH